MALKLLEFNFIGQRERPLEVTEGNHSDSYPLLTKYASEVRKSNPGSLVKIQCDKLTKRVSI